MMSEHPAVVGIPDAHPGASSSFAAEPLGKTCVDGRMGKPAQASTTTAPLAGLSTFGTAEPPLPALQMFTVDRYIDQTMTFDSIHFAEATAFAKDFAEVSKAPLAINAFEASSRSLYDSVFVFHSFPPFLVNCRSL